MTYRINKNVLVINESSFFARRKITKAIVTDYDLYIHNGDVYDWFSFTGNGTVDQKFIAKLKQELEAWLNGDHESNH